MYFGDNYKMIGIDLSDQQALYSDAIAIQQIDFTSNLDRANSTRIFLILGEVKEIISHYSQGNVKVL